jgi:hypothetical protein
MTPARSQEQRTMSETKQDLYLLVQEERSHDYYHLRARVVTKAREERDTESYPGGTRDRYQGPKYDGLQAGCQGDQGSRKAEGREGAVYGFGRLEYREVFSVDLGDAERMVKTLRALERKIAKLGEVRGYARSYGEFLGRFAEALGAKGMVFRRNQKHAATTGQTWEWTTVGDGINKAANLIYQWQREGQPEGVSA